MVDALNRLLEGLESNRLTSIRGSVFDNAFNVFNNPSEKNSLVVIGTNGNITDARHTTAEWLRVRADKPSYCHVTSGDWGNSPLQPQLKRLPDVFNECLKNTLCSFETTIFTNALLLASSGVGDIRKQFEIMTRNGGRFSNVNELVTASLRFFSTCTLSFAEPMAIFAYGNSDSDSAWGYLRQNHRIVKELAPTRISKGTNYKFCVLDFNGRMIPIVGSPHLSYRYNKPIAKLIAPGLQQLGVYLDQC